MDYHQNFCLQSLKDELDNCENKEVGVDDGTKKASEGEEVSRLTKTTINVEKSHNDKKEKGKKRGNCFILKQLDSIDLTCHMQ